MHKAGDHLVEMVQRDVEAPGDAVGGDALVGVERMQVHQHAQAVVGEAVELHGGMPGAEREGA
jgi:hypothetical protein